jgi:hypothetical protein
MTAEKSCYCECSDSCFFIRPPSLETNEQTYAQRDRNLYRNLRGRKDHLAMVILTELK